MSAIEVRKQPFLIPILTLVLVLVWLRPVDTLAERYVDDGFKRALVTFATARVINAAISFAKEAEVSFQAGAGGSIKPGAALDPLDDMVEQFSTIMLAATVSFAIQSILIAVFGAAPVRVLLALLLVAWMVQKWRGREAPWWLPRLALALVCLRLAIPFVALASETTYQLLLADSYQSAQAQIQTIESPESAVRPDEGIMERARRWWAQIADLGKNIEEVRAKAQGMVEHLVRLAAVFIVQTIVLPILFLWVMLWLYRGLAGSALFASATRRSTPGTTVRNGNAPAVA